MNPPNSAGPRRFVALDRDGTLIAEKNYLSDPAQVELLPGVRDAVDRLRTAGFGLIVVTNQSGVGRGYFTLEQVDAVNRRVVELLGQFDGIYICPHAPSDGCTCRKPLPGLLRQASSELNFSLSDCVVIGDKDVDVGLAHNAGARGVLVTTGYGARHLATGLIRPDFVATSLAEAANWVLSDTSHAAGPE
ncbi:HAD family hydrolase [uncultured Paludibaculum sp.]|uniref:D-glycero-alpha-D-manno-heptose-1,7-bisphosphate 7-phosphatase n=1 Tax=uncultured Paludibaculum sp. TaxID=1765020 RepID=UPI002AAB725E|nr:HAD family hydrolase [uncultured Paludibaculum sp.]